MTRQTTLDDTEQKTASAVRAERDHPVTEVPTPAPGTAQAGGDRQTDWLMLFCD